MLGNFKRHERKEKRKSKIFEKTRLVEEKKKDAHVQSFILSLFFFFLNFLIPIFLIKKLFFSLKKKKFMHSGRECNNTHYNIVLSSALGASNVDAAKAKVVAFILVLLLLLLLFALRIWENYRLRLCVVTDIKGGELGLFGNFGAFQFHWFGVIRKGDDLSDTARNFCAFSFSTSNFHS